MSHKTNDEVASLVGETEEKISFSQAIEMFLDRQVEPESCEEILANYVY